MSTFLNKLKLYFSNTHHPLQKKIKYTFKNKILLEQALTHKSISSDSRLNYERLEFLGDSVLDIIISKKLMESYPQDNEGSLTKKRALLVQKSFLSKIADQLELIKYLKIKKNVNLKIKKITDKQAANIFESLLGAIYLDSGLKDCENIILRTVWVERENAWGQINYKGELIELCHLMKLNNPIFKIIKTSGLDHQKIFEVDVQIGETKYEKGIGNDKKSAEQLAAKNAFEKLIK